MSKTLGLICGIFYGVAQAQSLGVVGEVFPVAEMSFLAWIESRLQDADVVSKVRRFEENATQAVRQYVIQPPSLHLPPAIKTQTHLYVPQITLKADVRDANGRVLLRQGTTVNALSELPTYQPYWIFFDGSTLSQQRWAQKELHQQTHPKVILTGGSLQNIASLFQQEIFFDQVGRISRQLGIKHVPAKVIREGNSLLITELSIKEDGDAR